MPISSSVSEAGNTHQSSLYMSNKVFGMIVFLYTEIMFFTALTSSYLVIKADRVTWSIPDHIQLSTIESAFSCLFLLISGYYVVKSGREIMSTELASRNFRYNLVNSLIFGSLFFLFQVSEWYSLISYGFTMKSSIFGSCFFLIVGSHALHVLVGLAALFAIVRSKDGETDLETFTAVQLFWMFVVGMWPILYALMYFES